MPSGKFTKKQLHDYFKGQFEPEQVDQALIILAQKNPEIDPTGNSFPLRTTDDLQEIFKSTGATLEAQKQLGQGEVPAQTLEAGEFSHHSNPELVGAILKAAAQGAVELGTAITQVQSHVLAQVLQQGDMAIARSVFGRSQQISGYARSLAGDGDRLGQIAANYGVQPVNIDAFLEEVRLADIAAQNSTKLLPPTKRCNIDQFLLEAANDHS